MVLRKQNKQTWEINVEDEREGAIGKRLSFQIGSFREGCATIKSDQLKGSRHM